MTKSEEGLKKGGTFEKVEKGIEHILERVGSTRKEQCVFRDWSWLSSGARDKATRGGCSSPVRSSKGF